MIRETSNTKKREIRFPGICGAAKQLGVNRVHLYLVLSGQRESKRLLNGLKKIKFMKAGYNGR